MPRELATSRSPSSATAKPISPAGLEGVSLALSTHPVGVRSKT